MAAKYCIAMSDQHAAYGREVKDMATPWVYCEGLAHCKSDALVRMGSALVGL